MTQRGDGTSFRRGRIWWLGFATPEAAAPADDEATTQERPASAGERRP